jgi:hypothetical protein
MTQEAPGQIWWDKEHMWRDANGSLHVVCLLLPADMKDNKYPWKTARFMPCGQGRCGTHIRQVNEKEIRPMRFVGNIGDIRQAEATSTTNMRNNEQQTRGGTK